MWPTEATRARRQELERYREPIAFHFSQYMADNTVIIFGNSYNIWIVDASRFTSAGKLLISDRNPSVSVHMVASNTARKC